jgi:protoporphyrinogen oxidase
LNIGIIGGGVAGLTAAYRLAKDGNKVTVFEARSRTGGQAATFPIAGTDLEIFYHHLFTGDREILELFDELVLSSQMQWLDSKVGFFSHGSIYNLTTPIDLLKFRPLPPLDRIRVGLCTLYLQRTDDWKHFEKVTAQDWIRKYAGRHVFEDVWGAQIRAKFGDMADEVSMAWFWGKIHLRLSSRDKSMGKEKLGYMTGSFQRFLDTIESGIRANGGEIVVSAPVENVEKNGAGISISAAGSRYEFEQVIATVPSTAFLKMAPGVTGDYAAKLQHVKYQSAACLVMQVNQPLSHIYWLNIGDSRIPFIGVIEHTNLIPPQVYGGKRIIYVTNYLSRESEYYSMSPEQLLAAYEPHLKKINRNFDKSWVEQLWCFREDAAQPVIGLNYSDYLPDFQTPVPGLYLANTTQIYPEDRGMNYSVRLGNQIAARVLSGSKQ